MVTERLIKKYPNRRLYDTEQSKYITLADVRDLVMTNAKFSVIDTSSKEDITRQILMQIIIEEEAGGKPLFSAQMLAQLIRFYGDTMQGMFTRYLEQSFNLFENQQAEFTKSAPPNPVESFNELTKQNLQMWNSLQESFLSAAGMSDEKKKS